MRFPLPKAKAAAQAALEWLAPFTERQVVVGSIRRERPDVGDIDLVVIPRVEVTKDLLGQEERSRNLLAEEIHREVQRRARQGWKLIRGGPDVWIIQGSTMQLDLWVASPERWGTLMLCRTGSREFNIELAARAIARGMKWNPHQGLFAGRQVCGATEEEIFHALDLRPVPPPLREAGATWRFQTTPESTAIRTPSSGSSAWASGSQT